jgi:hypothetical protein
LEVKTGETFAIWKKGELFPKPIHFHIIDLVMKIGKLISSRDGGGAAGATNKMISPLILNDDETQTTSDRIEILLERENRSSISKRQEKEPSTGDFRLHGSSGVEVVTVPVAPILSSDTSFTLSKTFGDESMIAETYTEHLCIVGSTQNEDGPGCDGIDEHHSVNRERIEMALDADKEPLYKKLWGFVPITPRGLRQQELNVVIDEETSPQENFLLNESSPMTKVLAEFQGQPTGDSSSRTTSERNDFEETESMKDTTAATDTPQKPLMPGEVSSSPANEISPRFIGRTMNLHSSVPMSTEIDSVPTYDTRMGIIKEQFEATIESSYVAKGKKWKSVAFGLGLSNPHNSIKGNLKSILRLRASEPKRTGSSASSDSCGPKADNENSATEGMSTSTGPMVEFKPKEGSIWPRRRVPSFTRPYSDRGSVQEGVELVKQAFGSRQHSFLRSITFDEEQVGQRRTAERISNWIPLRRSRSEIIKTNLKEEIEGDALEPNENHSEELAMLKKSSSSVIYRQDDLKKTNGDVPHQMAGSDVAKPSDSIEKDGSMIVKEYFLPMDHDGIDSFANSSIPQPTSVLGESTIANMETLKVLPCPVVQSAPFRAPSKLCRKSSTTVTVVRVPNGSSAHQYYRHVSSSEEKKAGGMHRLGKAMATGESTEIERQIQEVAKARMRPDQSLQDALEELEVELLEARSGKSREIRDAMFRRIRNQTQRRIIERGGAEEPSLAEFH